MGSDHESLKDLDQLKESARNTETINYDAANRAESGAPSFVTEGGPDYSTMSLAQLTGDKSADAHGVRYKRVVVGKDGKRRIIYGPRL